MSIIYPLPDIFPIKYITINEVKGLIYLNKTIIIKLKNGKNIKSTVFENLTELKEMYERMHKRITYCLKAI